LLVLILWEDVRIGIIRALEGMDFWVLAVLFLLALAWWSKSK
jgi:hypothetical protein